MPPLQTWLTLLETFAYPSNKISKTVYLDNKNILILNMVFCLNFLKTGLLKKHPHQTTTFEI